MVTYTNADIVMALLVDIGKAGSLREWARTYDFTPGYVSDVVNGRRDVSDRLAKALGFERVEGWRKT